MEDLGAPELAHGVARTQNGLLQEAGEERKGVGRLVVNVAAGPEVLAKAYHADNIKGLPLRSCRHTSVNPSPAKTHCMPLERLAS